MPGSTWRLSVVWVGLAVPGSTWRLSVAWVGLTVPDVCLQRTICSAFLTLHVHLTTCKENHTASFVQGGVLIS